jgi:hypothetical protein
MLDEVRRASAGRPGAVGHHAVRPLARIADHPLSRVDALLSWRWRLVSDNLAA